MKKHPILRALPLFRPLIKNAERLEKDQEKLAGRIKGLKTQIGESNARLQTLEAMLRSERVVVDQPAPAEGKQNPAPPETGDALFAQVQVDGFEKPRFEKFPYAGPFPWLDRPDAEEQIEARLAAGVIGEYEAAQFRCWKNFGYIILERAIEPDLLDEFGPFMKRPSLTEPSRSSPRALDRMILGQVVFKMCMPRSLPSVV